MNKKIFKALGLISLLSVASLSSAVDFSNFYFFGDSLSDKANTKDSPYTDNPPGIMWVDALTKKFGKSTEASSLGGDNYAVAGTSTYDLARQFSELHAKRQSLDSNGLYSIWSGANDLFSVIGKPDPISALIAVTEAGTTNIVAMLTKINQLGGRYIMVTNIPDLDLVPEAFDDPSFKGAGSAARYYNAEMLSKINALPFDVIQVDIYSFLEQISANGKAYGFDNVTQACKDHGNCEHSLFWDEVHPSSLGHRVMADYFYSILTAPNFAALLVELPNSAYSAQNRIIEQNLQPAAHAIPLSKAAFFTGGNYASIKANPNVNHYATHLANDNISLTAGLLYAASENLTVGAGFGYSRNQANFTPLNNSSVSWQSKLLSLFANYRVSKAYLNSIFSFGTLDFSNIQRKFKIGPVLQNATGSTSGSLYGLHLGTGYQLISRHNLTTGPFATADYLRVTVDPYTEQGAYAANIAFHAQTKDYLSSGLGWEVSLKQRVGTVDTLSRIFVTGNRQWFSGDRDIGFHVASLPGSHASLPVSAGTTNYISTGFNIGTQLLANLGLSLGYEFDKGNHDLQQHNVMLNLQYQLN